MECPDPNWWAVSNKIIKVFSFPLLESWRKNYPTVTGKLNWYKICTCLHWVAAQAVLKRWSKFWKKQHHPYLPALCEPLETVLYIQWVRCWPLHPQGLRARWSLFYYWLSTKAVLILFLIRLRSVDTNCFLKWGFWIEHLDCEQSWLTKFSGEALT